jgi:hypothetical protein
MATLVGLTRYANVLADRVSEIGVEEISVALAEEAAMWTEIVNDQMSRWVARQTKAGFKVKLPGNRHMQPLDMDGNPRPQVITGNYEVGFPVFGSGDAIGFNRETIQTMTVQEVSDQVDSIMNGDMQNIEERILRQWLYSASWTFIDKQRADLPNVTVQPFANNDSVVYTRWGDDSATDNHYLAQAASIADANNPFPTIFEELREHPSNNIRQNGQVITYVPTNLITSIEGLATLEEVKNSLIIPGISADRVDDAILNFIGFGNRVIGLDSGNVIIEWKSLPNNYMVSYAPDTADKLFGMRERPEPALQGLFTELADIDGNHRVSRWLRFFGLGVLNRVAGLAYQIGNATYVNPTGFDPREEG